MRQSRIYRPRPQGTSGTTMRMLSMIGMLLVLGMLISRAGDPRTWSWLAGDHSPVKAAAGDMHANVTVANRDKLAPVETIVAGPTDQDADEQEAAREEFQAVGDRVPLSAQEMPAYWRLMSWSRAQSFAQMQERARRDLLFTQLWERPSKYRGELTLLKLHIKRVLTYDAPENEAGVKQLYEAWGWTDDSKSFPYVVVCSELPAGMKLGADVSEEATFAGYFVKLFPYQAFDVKRAAPLFVGRLHWKENLALAALEPKHDSGVFWLTLAGGGVLLMLAIARWIVVRRWHKKTTMTSTLERPSEQWLEQVEQGEGRDAGIEEQTPAAWGPVDLHLNGEQKGDW